MGRLAKTFGDAIGAGRLLVLRRITEGCLYDEFIDSEFDDDACFRHMLVEQFDMAYLR